MKMVYFNATTQTVKTVNVSDDLHDYYKLLDCTLIDVTPRKIGGKYYDVIVDDEGFLKAAPVPSAITSKLEPVLVGNLLITQHNSEGETIDLTRDDIARIKRQFRPLMTRGGGIFTFLICDY